jgi:large subunit ribosomal protein L23
MKLPYIIKKPIITEQSLQSAKLGEYTFDVDPSATKGQIKKAIETYFDVSVVRVRTAKLAGKTKRVGKLKKKLIKSDRKKAMIKVKSGQKISLFEVQGQ